MKQATTISESSKGKRKSKKQRDMELQIQQLKDQNKNEEKLCETLMQDLMDGTTLLQLQREKLQTKEWEYQDLVRNVREHLQECFQDVQALRNQIASKLISHYENSSNQRLQIAKNIKSQEEAHSVDISTAVGECSYYTNALLEVEASHHNLVCMMKMEHAQTMKENRAKCAEELKHLQRLYHSKIHNMRIKAQEARDTTNQQLEAEKLNEIIAAQTQHENNLKGLRSYFNDLQTKNWNLIRDLSVKVEKLKGIDSKYSKRLHEAESHHQALAEPLEQAKEELDQLHESIKLFKDRKEEYNKYCKDTKLKERKLQLMQLRLDASTLKLSRLQEQHKLLLSRSEMVQHKIRQRSGFKALLLKFKANFVDGLPWQYLRASGSLPGVVKAAEVEADGETISAVQSVLLKQSQELESLSKKFKFLKGRQINTAKFCQNIIAGHAVTTSPFMITGHKAFSNSYKNQPSFSQNSLTLRESAS